MKNLLVKLRLKIKSYLGLCCSKSCYENATVNVYFPVVDIKRCLCNKHSAELERIFLCE